MNFYQSPQAGFSYIPMENSQNYGFSAENDGLFILYQYLEVYMNLYRYAFDY